MPSGVAAGAAPERRGSTSSEGSAAGSTHNRSLSSDEPEYLQAAKGRISKAIPPKPAANPLQFIKVGPCELFRSAQEQLKRSEEVRKTKEVKKEEQEDWQSNLDNWKSSRRKRVEHIIERCVEVKRITEEDQARERRRSKTFSEMMEDRAGRKNARLPLPIYSEEDNNDLSDLGIGTSSASGKSSLSEDCDNHSLASDGMDLDKNHSDLDNMSEVGIRKLGSSANEYDTCTTATISSPEPEEYTYEGAIQSYKSRIIPRTQSTEVITNKVNSLKDSIKEKSPESYTNGNLRRTSLGNKIENKLSSFEQRRSSSVELSNADTNKKILPKVDVLKRRELFEKESSPESNGLGKKLNGDLSNSKSIKDRLSHLEKLTEYPDTVKSTSVLPTEASSLKQRLSSLEKHVAVTDKISTKLSNGDLSNAPSVRDRLSSLKSHNSQDKLTVNNLMSSGMTQTIKERLSNLDSATNKSVIRSPEREITIKLKQNNGYNDMEFREDSSYESHQNSSERNSSPESGLYDSKRFHRSLDSLDTDDNLPTGKFERIQSSEDLCGETGTGGETDREDSGIHTGDVSCAVSHADETAEEHLSLTLLGTSTISQDTVVNVDGILSESPQPDTEDCSYKDFCPVLSHSSVTEDDPPTVEETTDVFFDREEEDTVKSMEPDTSVVEALDIAFEAIDVDEPVFDEQVKEKMVDLPRVEESLNILKPKKETPPVQEIIKMEESKMVTEKEITAEAVTKQFTQSMPKHVPQHVPLYENIDMLYSGLAVSNDMVGFPLGPPKNAMEPPKEKPPPPPVDDDDLNSAPLIRLNSTKRIKKEIRNKRSSFLGLEGGEDDSYLEPQLSLAPRPDITSFLQEETRVEKLLYRKTLYYDSDSNLGESRDSGVELDRGHSDDTWSNKQPSPDTLSEQHSRQGSEPFTNTSMTSEEEEMGKKDRDFTDGSDNEKSRHFAKPNSYSERQDLMGQQLTDKLIKLEQEKIMLEKQRSIEGNNGATEDDGRIRSLEEQIREQQEVLRVERELLQLEQEELKRQRDNLVFRENQARRGRSLQDINMIQSYPTRVSKEPAYSYAPPVPAGVNYRQSMPDLAMEQAEIVAFAASVANGKPSPAVAKASPMIIKKLPPPVPPLKPTRTTSLEMQERELNVRSSRMPSASSEYANIDRESGLVLRQKPPVNNNAVPHHQMTRNTLHALSAAPRSRLIPAADWLQPKRRSDPQNYDYNQHWLIQEAEQRRIDQLRSNIKKQAQTSPQSQSRPKHLPDAIIQSLTQRAQGLGGPAPLARPGPPPPPPPLATPPLPPTGESPERMLSVSGKKKCSHCGEELGRGAAMIIESLRLFYHLSCFQCCVCGVRLGDGRLGADVRVRHNQLHCHNCYSSDDGVKFSCV